MEITTKIDPELEPALAALPDIHLSLETLDETRSMAATLIASMKAQLPPVQGVARQDRHIPGPPGEPDVPIRIYTPTDRPGQLPALLWIHGGGYVMGAVDQDDHPAASMAAEAGCVVVSVDYRLAPEHTYPAPLEDCYAALKWMSAAADDLLIDPSKMAIGGASAGGGLAAGLALLARDRAEVAIAFQLLIYPMLDDRNIAPAGEGLADTLVWSRHSNRFGWHAYLNGAAGTADLAVYAAAARADDLSGLPPAVIAVGDIDLFAPEDITYARRLIRCGVPTELQVYPGAYHGFNNFVPTAAVSRRCHDSLIRALRTALHR